MVRNISLCFFLICFATPVRAQVQNFETWRATFADEALANGIAPSTLKAAWPYIVVNDDVIDLDSQQPEKTVSFEYYLQRTINDTRIARGKERIAKHEAFLSMLAGRYGMDPGMIVALWGIESDFGDNTGWHEVITSLTSLAFEGRREKFFRAELINALKIISEEGVDPGDMIGSWAGAMGQCQFMPSVYRRFAADGNGDGKRDIWNNEQDVLASIAAYLAAESWKPGQPWGRPVHLGKKKWRGPEGLEKTLYVKEWLARGVRPLDKVSAFEKTLKASLIRPDGPGGRAFLVYDNFRALMRWNRSVFFASAVGILSDSLEKGH